ncbi:MAG TPA: hypothetical protein VL262_01870, partial [Vicinamibacterales bacterium]|nr:hypothetical protein [Vicinamibacterales bacterium]
MRVSDTCQWKDQGRGGAGDGGARPPYLPSAAVSARREIVSPRTLASLRALDATASRDARQRHLPGGRTSAACGTGDGGARPPYLPSAAVSARREI